MSVLPDAILKADEISVVPRGRPETQTRVFLPLCHRAADHVLLLVTWKALEDIFKTLYSIHFIRNYFLCESRLFCKRRLES